MSTTNNPAASNDPNSQKDVPLGPACLVVFVVGLMLLCVAVAYMSFMLTGNQGPRAAIALRKQLIPWVDDSALSKSDQAAIIDQLNDLASKMEQGELTSRQLSRLGIRLQDSTILQWGVVEDVLRYVKESKGFADQEKEDIQKTCDRWLRCASEGKLSMTEMEFAFQGFGLKDPRSGRLSLRKDITDDQIREFHRRVLGVCEKYKTSTEPFEKSVSQVFRMMMEDGLSEK